MHKPVGVGIIGAGFIGRVHAKSARMAGGALVGVVDSTSSLSQALAADLGFDKVFTQAEDLITDPAIDVVHVCVPNYMHAPFVTQAIAAGKHVVCEKPLAMTVAEAEQLESLATAAGVVAAIPFVYRYYPIVREIRERIRGGEGGRLNVLHGSYLQDWLASDADTDWRVDRTLGGAVTCLRGHRRALGRSSSSSPQASASLVSALSCSPSFRRGTGQAGRWQSRPRMLRR